MVTLHLNSDIVVHPDHKANYERRMKRYERDNKCRYGVIIHLCRVAVQNKQQSQGLPTKLDTSYCNLDCSELCPKWRLHRTHGKKVKTYSMTTKHYRELADRAAYMKETAVHNLLFCTLTFGNWKRKTITDEHANKCFSKFMENLKKNYGVKNYIAVREHSEEHTKRVHFHVILDMPYHDFRRVNDAWNHSIKDYCNYSPNAFTTDKDARYIKSTVQAVRYICKYLSKSRTEAQYSRIIFCSRELSQATVKTDFSGNDWKEVLTQFKSIQIFKHNDFCWRYSISCPKDAPPAQKEKTIKAANAFYYMVVRSMFDFYDTYFDENDIYHNRRRHLAYYNTTKTSN